MNTTLISMTPDPETIKREDDMSYRAPFNWEQMLSYYWWKTLFFKITGGRPMIDRGHNFIDKVSGKTVRNYTDRFGREWMADSGPWSFFRVRRNDPRPRND